MNAIDTLNAENPRFMPKVSITDTCWLWTGAKNNHGYGIIMAIFLSLVYIVKKASKLPKDYLK